MIRIVTVAEMQEAEKKCYQQGEMSEALIIENVGLEIASHLLASTLLKKFPQMPIVCFFGKGHNGADALSVVRHLKNRGRACRDIFAVGCYPEHEWCPQLKKNYRQAIYYGVKTLARESLNLLPKKFIAIDGLLGTGARLPLPSLVEEMIDFINERASYCVAIDIPSGILGDSGETAGKCVRAHITYAILFPKWGHFLGSMASSVGKLKIILGGFPLLEWKSISTLTSDTLLSLNTPYYRSLLKRSKLEKRDSFAHKQNFGHLLSVGGSKGLMGAISLCTMAAEALGVGLLTAQTVMEKDYLELVASMPAEVMKGVFDYDQIKDFSSYSAVVVGPGLGKGSEKRKAVTYLMENIAVPLLIDADGINQLKYKHDKELFQKRTAPTVITPHIGEMATFLDVSKSELFNYTPEKWKNLASELNTVIVLKNWQTFIIFPDQCMHIVRHPNAGLAKGGSGDVLSGIIGGILALKLKELTLNEIISLGVLLQVDTASWAKKMKGGCAMNATDLICGLTHLM